MVNITERVEYVNKWHDSRINIKGLIDDTILNVTIGFSPKGSEVSAAMALLDVDPILLERIGLMIRDFAVDAQTL